MISDKKFIELAKKANTIAKEKGFWTANRNIDELFMLIISELGEALEAHRKDRWADREQFKKNLEEVDYTVIGMATKESFELEIKDTVEDELADAIIRILDYTYHRKGEYFILNEMEFDFSDNFGENLFYATRLVSDRLYVEAAVYLFELCEHMEIDILWHIEEKMKYNSTREKLHGKKY